MEDIYIKTETFTLLKKYFKDKDLVSIEDLFALIDDLTYDYEKLKEDYEDLIQDVHDNYRYVGIREAIGYDERTW